MAKQTKQEIKSQSAGAYFTAIVNKQKYTIKPSVEERNVVKKEILAYNTKPSDNRLKKIISLLKPKEEKKKQEVLVLKKQVKNQEKENKKALPEKQKAIAEVVKVVEEVVAKKEEVQPEQIAKVAEKVEKIQETKPVQGDSYIGEHYR